MRSRWDQVPSFIKIGSGIQELSSRNEHTHRQEGDPISLRLLSQNKESGEKLKENEMARVRREMNTKFWYESLKGVQLEDLDVDGGRMLKQISD
jgi:hypothetical protein